MTKTLLDLFKGSPHDTNVKVETETVVETELKGLRIKSGADLNNPLLYGSDTIRIASRTTPTLETMREGINVTEGGTGLIGKGIYKLTGGKLSSISDVRNKISSTLGLPTPMIPTRVADGIKTGKTASDIIGSGTELGKLLRQTGGGKPKDIARNLLGGVISLGKDKLRSKLFGNKDILGTALDDTKNDYYYDADVKYSDVLESDGYKIEGGTVSNTNPFERIDVSKYSPIYGVERNSSTTIDKLPNEVLNKLNRNNNNAPKPSTFSPIDTYTNEAGSTNVKRENSLDLKYGISNNQDLLNKISPLDDYKSTDLEKLDLVPFWISKVGEEKRTHFRTLITGLSETVSPSWNSNQFFGNPFSYHTYTGIERGVTFTLQLYCMDEKELENMWERVTALTQFTYPTIDDERRVEPPIIEFRLGDIYNKKKGFLESLSYTIDDNVTWEIDPKVGLLPKVIDVSISIKFIEQYDDIFPSGSDIPNFYQYNDNNSIITFNTERINKELNPIQSIKTVPIKRNKITTTLVVNPDLPNR